MTDTPTQASATANMTASWYNALVTGLNLNPKEFQIAQGDIMLPLTSAGLWAMTDLTPEASVSQFYTPGTGENFSSQYTSILSDISVPSNTAFQTAMTTDYAPWVAARRAYINANPPALADLSKATLDYFRVWSAGNMDDMSKAKSCGTLLFDFYENPIGIGQDLVEQLPEGGEVPYNLEIGQVLQQVVAGPGLAAALDSSQQSSSLSNAWASSSNSAGGSYFYSTSSSQESSDFTQTFAGSDVTVEVEYAHVVTIQVAPLSSGSVSDGTASYPAWYYPAALTAAYKNTGWTGPGNWDQFFGPTGSLQYQVTGIVVADGVTQTLKSNATYSTAEQTYAHSESSSGYGCWPYYVTSDSSSTTNTAPSFDTNGRMTQTLTLPVGQPIILGFLVSSIAAEVS